MVEKSNLMSMDYHTACSNGDGTYDGVTAVQWMFEATTGRAMPREEAIEIVRKAQEKRRAQLHAEGR